jgi:hypothetical protein
MRRSMLLVVVALVMAALLVYSGVAWAEPTSCQSTLNANPSGGAMLNRDKREIVPVHLPN